MAADHDSTEQFNFGTCIDRISDFIGAVKARMASPGEYPETFPSRILSDLEAVVTELSTLQAKNSEHLSRYRSLFDASPDAVFLTIPDGGIEEANPAACAMFGYTEAEFRVLGRSGTLDTSDPRLGEALEERKRTGRFQGREYTAIRKDGERFPVEVDSVILPTAPPRSFVILRDISERKRAAEEEAKLSEQRRLALDSARLGSWHYDPESGIAFFDERFAEIFGIKGTQSPLERILERVHPDDLSQMLSRVKAAFDPDDPQPFHMEYRITHPDGTLRWVEAHGRAAVAQAGSAPYIARFVGTTADISERKQAEKLLNRQAALLDLSNEAIFTWELDGPILSWNKGAKRLYGFDREEAIGRVSHELLTMRHPDGIEAFLTEIVQTGTWTGELVHRTKDGRLIIVESRHQLVEDESGRRIVLEINRDVSERKHAEEALRESEERFRFALRNAPVSVAAQNRDLRYIWAYNQKTARSADIIGLTDEEIFTPEEAAHITPLKRRVVEEGIVLREQMWFSRPGGPMYLDVCCEPIREAEGRVIGVASATVDITTLKQAEEALRQAKEQAERQALELETILQVMGSGVQVYDGEGRIVRMNPTAKSIFVRSGLLIDKAAQPIRSRHQDAPLEIRDGDGRRLTMEETPAPRALRGEVVEDAVVEYTNRETGVSLWLHLAAVPLREVDGSLRGAVCTFTDITGLKRLEVAVRESEASYRELADSMPQLVWVMRADGKAEYFNSKRSLYESISQSPDGSWEWRHIIHPDDREATDAAFARAIETKSVFESEHRMLLADGSYRWHLSRATPSFDHDGRIRRWYGTCTDIHEQKLTEEELLFNQERFRAAARLTKISIAQLDTHHRYLWLFNPHEDFPVSNVVGKLDTEIHPLDRALALRAPREEAMRTGKIARGGISIALSDGLHHYDIVVEPQKDEQGTVTGVTSSTIDVTEKKNLEEALTAAKAEAERRAQELDAAFNAAAEAIIIDDADGNVVKINQVAEKLLGYSEEERKLPVEERIRRVESLNLDGTPLPPGEGAIQRALRGERVEYYEMMFRNRADGSQRVIAGMAAPIRAADGAILGVITSFRDITEDRRRAEELKAAKEQAEAANRAKTEFLAHMSHELRTPIGGIIGMADLLLPKLAGSPYERNVSLIRDSGHSLLSIIGDVLDLSQIESGKIEVAEREFSVQSLVESCVEPFTLPAHQAGLTLSAEVDETLSGYFRGDAEKIAQILRNFISNAIKYTERGSVRVHVNASRKTDDGVEALFTIADTGVGIPPEKQDFIFHEFTRIVPEHGARKAGTGLGLAIAKRLIELLGGELCLESEVGKGSTFYFTVPLKLHNGKHPSSDEQPEAESKRRPLKVLLAEDTVVNRLFLETVLQEAGHAVRSVENGREAVDAVSRERFDLVLMDIQMPEMDGLEATKAIRALDLPWRNLPIIALTAYAMRGDRERMLEAGMDEYVTKPVDIPLLMKIMQRVTHSADR